MLVSIFAGGLWAIDVFCLVLAAWFFYQAWQKSKSGTVTGGSSSNPKMTYSNENMKITEIKVFWLGVAMVIAWIVTIVVRIYES